MSRRPLPPPILMSIPYDSTTPSPTQFSSHSFSFSPSTESSASPSPTAMSPTTAASLASKHKDTSSEHPQSLKDQAQQLDVIRLQRIDAHLELGPEYTRIEKLSGSLFGSVSLMQYAPTSKPPVSLTEDPNDTHMSDADDTNVSPDTSTPGTTMAAGSRMVVVKHSHLADLVRTHPTIDCINYNDLLSTEDVYRESVILDFLGQAANTASYLPSICGSTKHMEGRSYIANLVDAKESKAHHHLVLEHVQGQELFEYVSKRSVQSRSEARQIFWKVCQAVCALHANGIAHLDISMENIIYNPATKQVKLIDFGVAQSHPDLIRLLHASLLRSGCNLTEVNNLIQTAEVMQRPYVHLYDATKVDGIRAKTPGCVCASCNSCSTKVPSQEVQKRPFLCYSLCRQICPPGKINYTPPEMHDQSFWDGYAVDCYALGVLLYALTWQTMPYNQVFDAKFRNMYDGTWSKTSRDRVLFGSEVDLVSCLIAPLEKRLTIDEILAHRYFKGMSV